MYLTKHLRIWQNRKPSPPRHFIFPDVEKPCTPCSARTHDVRAAGHPPRADESYYDFEPMATSTPEPWGQPVSRQYRQVPPPPESWDYRPSVGQVTPHYGNFPLASVTWDNSTDQIPPQAWNVPCPPATGNRPTPCEGDEVGLMLNIYEYNIIITSTTYIIHSWILQTNERGILH